MINSLEKKNQTKDIYTAYKLSYEKYVYLIFMVFQLLFCGFQFIFLTTNTSFLLLFCSLWVNKGTLNVLYVITIHKPK